MSKISKGDVVIVHKPLDVWEHPIWIPDMDKYDGKKFTVSNVFEFDNTALLIGTGGLSFFNINRLQPVKEEAEEMLDKMDISCIW